MKRSVNYWISGMDCVFCHHRAPLKNNILIWILEQFILSSITISSSKSYPVISA